MPILQVHQVSKQYGGVKALEQVSLTVEPGEFIALMGPSGCGKSTLLNLLGAIDTPTHGDIRLDGVNIATLGDNELTRIRREKMGYIFQTFNLLSTLTVAENVALPLALIGGLSSKTLQHRVREALEQVGLAHRIDFFPAQLSGGEMQRTAIARALIHQPRLILADEPTGNLDSENGENILSQLRALSTHSGQTIIMATHSPEAAAVTTRTIRMKDGRILQDESTPP